MAEVVIEDQETSTQGQPADLHFETHNEILTLLTWAAWLAKTVPCCQRTFADLIERLVQLGPLFASLAKENQGGKVGSKAEELINELQRKQVEIELKALKRAVNAAYQLQHVLYALDDSDRDAYAKTRLLEQNRQPNADFNPSSSEVTYINGEPLELLPDMLAKLARGGTTAHHRYIGDNAELKSIYEKVAKGDLEYSSDEEDVPEGSKLKAEPRQSRCSISGIWTRPQPLSLDSIITSPRVLWEVDTPTEFSMDDESLESFENFDVERSFTESASKGSKGKLGVEPYSSTSSSKALQDPPPPQIQDVTAENEELNAPSTRRISFPPGQEAGERRESYLEGTIIDQFACTNRCHVNG